MCRSPLAKGAWVSERIPTVWWVTHNQSFEDADDSEKGKYIWALSNESRGRQCKSSECLTEMLVGDIVIHYRKMEILAVGCVLEAADPEKPIRRPNRPDDGSRLGWHVEVDYRKLHPHIRRDEMDEDLRKGSDPFDKRGRVKRGFAYRVSNDVVDFLRNRLGPGWPE
jgi:hypothetical protein